MSDKKKHRSDAFASLYANLKLFSLKNKIGNQFFNEKAVYQP